MVSLDREVKDRYQLTVYASDLGSISKTASANVQVFDCPVLMLPYLPYFCDI